jgi:uncharacterized cupin superfamily protein
MDIVQSGDIEWADVEHGEATFREKQLTEGTDAERLGCSLYELPPGKSSWPHHYHLANEEAFYVLAGTGLVAGPDGDQAVEEGDYVTCPVGDAGAHRFVNDGDVPLRFLAVSTMNEPDVAVYPEMEKFGVYVSEDADGDDHAVRGMYRLGNRVDYWDDDA